MKPAGFRSRVMEEGFLKVPGEHGSFTVEPMPDAAQLAAFYRDQYYQTSASATYANEYPEEELEWKRLMCDLAVHLLQRQGLSGGRLVDLGSGEGFLVDAALRAGFDAYGVDFSEFAVERFHPHLRGRVSAGDVLGFLDRAIASGETFDACTLQHLVEHVPDPEQLLRSVWSTLASRGLALVTVPNDENALQHLAMEQKHIDEDFWFVPPQHLHYFDTTSAPALARATGFEVLDLVTDFPIDLFLLHPGSNYVRDREQGRAAHQARIAVESLLGRRGLESLRDLGAAQARCGIGRDLTMVLRKVGE